jgi:MFS transporter, PAT family, beta-lactamase induction signal transducer AmpG
VQTAILLAIGIVPLLVKERSGPPPPRPPLRQIAEGFGQVATIPSTLVVAIFILLLNIALGIVAVTSIGLYTADLKWTVTKYTDLVGGLGLVAGFGGSILGGFLSDLLGRRRVLAIASIGLGAGWLLFAAAQPLWNVDAFVYPLAVWEAVCQSVMLVTAYALCMDASWPRIAATQFAAYMALSSLSSTIGYKLAPKVIEALGDTQMIYVLAGCFQVVVTAILLAIDPTAARRRLPLAPGWHLGPIGILTAVVSVIAVAIVPVALFWI